MSLYQPLGVGLSDPFVTLAPPLAIFAGGTGILFRGSSSSNGLNGSMTINMPTSIAAGDVLVMIGYSAGNGAAVTWNATAGWTLNNQDGTNDVNKDSLAVFIRAAVAADSGASYTFTTNGTTDHLIGIVRHYSGPAGVTNDGNATFTNGILPGGPTGPSITSSGAGRMWIQACAAVVAGAAPFFSWPTGFRNQVNRLITVGGIDLETVDRLVGNGATGTTTITYTGSGNIAWITGSFLLKP